MGATQDRPHIVIVGGGIIGTAIAWQVAKRLGDQVSITLFEKGTIGTGSTVRSIGTVETQYLTPEDVRTRAVGMDELAALEKDRGPVIHRNGYLRIGRTGEARDLFTQSVEWQQECGVTSARVIDPDEIAARVPGIDTAGMTAGLFGDRDGFVDPKYLSELYADEARSHRASIHEHRPVDRVLTANGKVRGVILADGSEVPADVVVNAAGAWATRLNESFGLDVTVVGYRHQMATFEVPESYPDVPQAMDFLPGSGKAGVYFRKDRPTRLIVGLHDDFQDPTTASDPDHYNREVDKEMVERTVNRLREVAPGLTDQVTYTGGWAGLYPFTDSAEPEVREVDDSGFVLAVGFGGVGIQMSPWAGREVVQILRSKLGASAAAS
jgi:sarcosine oxidase, subunit beta